MVGFPVSHAAHLWAIVMLMCVKSLLVCVQCAVGYSYQRIWVQHTCVYPCVSPFAGLGYLCPCGRWCRWECSETVRQTDSQSADHRCVKCFGLVCRSGRVSGCVCWEAVERIEVSFSHGLYKSGCATTVVKYFTISRQNEVDVLCWDPGFIIKSKFHW